MYRKFKSVQVSISFPHQLKWIITMMIIFISLFISTHPSTSQVMFTVEIFTCADDIPLGVFGGTCIELTLGGRPENKKKIIT